MYADSSSNGEPTQQKSIWSVITFCAGEAPMNGSRPWMAFQIENIDVPSREALSPQAPKRRDAQMNRGTGANASAWVSARQPVSAVNASTPVDTSAVTKIAASNCRGILLSRSHMRPLVKRSTTVGTMVSSASMFENNLGPQTIQ